MKYDKTLKKDWYVFGNGQWFSSLPKDEREGKIFEDLISEARRYGWKVCEVWFQKTEHEFHHRFDAIV